MHIYWFSFICLSYRWNAHYLLYTILQKYVDHTDIQQEHIATNDSWNRELVLWLLILFSTQMTINQHSIYYSLLPLILSLYLLAHNMYELHIAIPLLAKAQEQRQRDKQTNNSNGKK